MYGAPGWTAKAEFIPVNFDVFDSRTDTVHVNGEFHGPQRYLSPAEEHISRSQIVMTSCPMTSEPGGIGRLQVYNAGTSDEYLELEVDFTQCTKAPPRYIGFRLKRQ